MKRITPEQKKRIHAKILTLKGFPDVTNVKKLTNFEPAYRMRIGDYRILFDVINNCVEIGRVLHRSESYRQIKK